MKNQTIYFNQIQTLHYLLWSFPYQWAKGQVFVLKLVIIYIVITRVPFLLNYMEPIVIIKTFFFFRLNCLYDLF